MKSADIPRLEVPAITEEALRKGEGLARWLDNIRRVPQGVGVMALNCVEFSLTAGYSEDELSQCAVVIPGQPLPVTRVTWDYTANPGKRVDTKEALLPTFEPVIVASFEFGEDFEFDKDTEGCVPIEASSVRWIPPGSSADKIQLYETYLFDPTAHRLAVIDGWHNPRQV